MHWVMDFRHTSGAWVHPVKGDSIFVLVSEIESMRWFNLVEATSVCRITNDLMPEILFCGSLAQGEQWLRGLASKVQTAQRSVKSPVVLKQDWLAM